MVASKALRTSVCTMLSTIFIEDKRVPIYEQYVQETDGNTKAILDYGDQEIELYMIYKNQDENEAPGSKCGETSVHSFQIHIYSVFPSDTGTSDYAEDIEEAIRFRLIEAGGWKSKIQLYNQYLLNKTSISRGRNLSYNDDTKRIWTKVIQVDNWITRRYT